MNATLIEPDTLEEYFSEAGFLWLQRRHAVHAPHYDRQQFSDLDESLAAHLEGVRMSDVQGWAHCEQALAGGEPEDFFVATVTAMDAPAQRMKVVIDALRDAPESMAGVISALGWVPFRHLEGHLAPMFSSRQAVHRKLAIAACACHRHDPGAWLDDCLGFPADSVRVRAVRAAGELGRRDVLPSVLASLDSSKPELRYWAARSATLLGDRAAALSSLRELVMTPGPRQLPALADLLHVMEPADAHRLLASLEGFPGMIRLRIIGAGHTGNTRYVPWLIDRMTDAATARVAAEAFVNITGADFNLDQLEALPPDGFEDGPTEDPDDENVELPEDIPLPWPDVERVRAWWSRHQGRFPLDRKLLLGQDATPERCRQVLQTGLQRQRVLAANLLCLAQPGSVLFPTSAPAWRQQRALEALGEAGGGT